jgi:hypothetical protein
MHSLLSPRSVSLGSTIDVDSVVQDVSISSLVQDILVATSGLDRGAAATSSDILRINAAVNALETASRCSLKGYSFRIIGEIIVPDIDFSLCLVSFQH